VTVTVSVAEVLLEVLVSPGVETLAVLFRLPTAAAAMSTLIDRKLDSLPAIGPGLVQVTAVVPEQLQPLAGPLIEL
jgi:hypothetical protein